MGRPFKNHCEEISIGTIKDRKFGLWQVKTPFFTKVTFKNKLGKYYNGKSIYGTSWEIINKPISKKDEITKEFLEKDKKIINMEEYYIQFLDICPLCGHNKGIPKIERKDTSDNRWRVSPHYKNTKTRPDEYRD